MEARLLSRTLIVRRDKTQTQSSPRLRLIERPNMFGGALLFVALAASALASVLSSFQAVLWEDLPDLDVFRVGNDFYYSASTMHYSPGAPLLHSKDLINWEYVSHSVPDLDWGPKYSLEGGQSAYVEGVFASSVRRRPSDGKWFWVGCVEYSRSYIYAASSAAGPWTKWAEFSNHCFYDCGLLFDDDDDSTPYVAYGAKTILVAKLSKDLKSLVGSRPVHTYGGKAEGSRMYKIKGTYYILNVDPKTSIEYVMQSKNVYGPYQSATLANGPKCPVPGAGSPQQGGIVDDPQGNWYYMAFCNSHPGGRVPVIAPITFNGQGFPQLRNSNEWPSPMTPPMRSAAVQPAYYQDDFDGPSLGPKWEWNHNPVISAFSLGNGNGTGLTLRTASVTKDLYQAQNTLTHRILGPKSRATIKLSYKDMKAGDRAGLVLLRDLSAWVGVINNDGKVSVGVWTGCALTLTKGNNQWSTTATGSLQTSAAIPRTEEKSI